MEEERQKNKIQDFKDLIAWQKGHQLVLMIYKITKEFPREEQFGLVNQLRRAAVSITSNIAEGFSRGSYKDKSKFYSMALGSLTEVQNQILISRDVGYTRLEIFNQVNELTIEVNKIINGLIKSSNLIHNKP
jgi:four helix bundle protein